MALERHAVGLLWGTLGLLWGTLGLLWARWD